MTVCVRQIDKPAYTCIAAHKCVSERAHLRDGRPTLSAFTLPLPVRESELNFGCSGGQQSVRILSTIYSARSVHGNTIRFYQYVDFHLFTSRPTLKNSRAVINARGGIASERGSNPE